MYLVLQNTKEQIHFHFGHHDTISSNDVWQILITILIKYQRQIDFLQIREERRMNKHNLIRFYSLKEEWLRWTAGHNTHIQHHSQPHNSLQRTVKLQEKHFNSRSNPTKQEIKSSEIYALLPRESTQQNILSSPVTG